MTAPARPRTCWICGCTDDDCSGCIAKTGRPCTWVADNLCSACWPSELTEPIRAARSKALAFFNAGGSVEAAADMLAAEYQRIFNAPSEPAEPLGVQDVPPNLVGGDPGIGPPVGSERRVWAVVDRKATEQPERWDGTNWVQAGPGEGPGEVWIPPSTDCIDFAHDPCPHCGSREFHHRTHRCAECGRRPWPAGEELPECHCMTSMAELQTWWMQHHGARFRCGCGRRWRYVNRPQPWGDHRWRWEPDTTDPAGPGGQVVVGPGSRVRFAVGVDAPPSPGSSNPRIGD